MFLLFDPVNPLLITQRVVNKDATLYIKWKEGRKEGRKLFNSRRVAINYGTSL